MLKQNIATLRQAIEQAQKQEPVDVTLYLEGGVYHTGNPHIINTSPPQRQPLTDEQIEKLAEQHLQAFAQFIGAGEVHYEGELEFARAIEAAHGINYQKGQTD